MKILIFTEGGENIGLGHISRCTALYQAFMEKGHRPLFVVNGDRTVNALLKGKRFRIFDWVKKCHRLLSLLEDTDVAIIDSYLAGRRVYKYISRNVGLAVYIDDFVRLDYPKGIVLNWAISAPRLKYPAVGHASYLLGSKYVLLRKEFWKAPQKIIINKKIDNIIVTFGGADFLNMTPRLLKFLNVEYPDLRKKVFIGKSFKNAAQILKNKDRHTEFLFYPSAQEMKKSMLKADLAISAGGQTLYELARLGVPTIGVCLARNQLLNLNGLAGCGFIKFSGWYNEKEIFNKIGACLNALTYENRLTMSRAGRKLVDGSGPSRVVRAILSNERKKLGIVLRNVTEGDCRDLWLWRNSPEARKGSFNSKPVLWGEHKKWFDLKLKSKKTSIYIAEQGVNKAGVIRFEEKRKLLAVSINLNPTFFGKGLGSKIIKIGTIKSLRERPGIRKVIAEIVSDNIASQKAFKKSGYVFTRKLQKNGIGADMYEFKERAKSVP